MGLVIDTKKPERVRETEGCAAEKSHPADHYLIDTENMGRDWVELRGVQKTIHNRHITAADSYMVSAVDRIP